MFLLYINDISAEISSSLRLFVTVSAKTSLVRTKI